MKKLPIFQKKLSNGLNIILIKKGVIPNFSINLAYNVGSKDEKLGRRGFAHLFEHLMFEGTRNLPKGEFDKLISLAGGSNNAYTTYDWTSYTMNMPSNQLELALWLESERMFNFEILPESLANQQNVVTEEIRQVVENRPYGRWRELLAKNAFDEQCSYSSEVHGRIEDVRNAKMEDVLKFKSQYYIPNKAYLAIVGNIDIDKTFELAEKYFDSSANVNEIPRNNFNTEYFKSGTFESYTDNVPHNAVFVAFHTPSLKDESHILNQIVANILGQGKSSLLHNSLVYNQNISAVAGAFADERQFDSLLTFFAMGSDYSIDTDRMYEAIMDIIRKVSKGDFHKDILTKTRNQLKTALANELMYSSGVADSAAKMARLYNEPERVFTALDEYNKISIDNVIAYTNKYLSDEKSIRIDVLNK